MGLVGAGVGHDVPYIVYKGKIIAPFDIDLNRKITNDDQESSASEKIESQTSNSASKYNPKKVVEDYEKAASNYTNSQEILDNIDFRGTLAWVKAKGKYSDFIKFYDTIKKDEIKEAKAEESKSWSYGSISRKIIKYDEIKELGEGLYAIKAQLKREGSPAYTSYYVVYKDKIIVPTAYTISNDYLSQYF